MLYWSGSFEKRAERIVKIEQAFQDGFPVFIIAEAGVNHNGRLDFALQLIDVACDAGADAVKFQSYITDNLIIEGVAKAPYQKTGTSPLEDQREMLKKFEIDKKFQKRLAEYCREKNILFMSTPYDAESLDILLEFAVPAIKVASTDATNILFLEQISATGLPVLLATGMCSLDEIRLSYATLRDHGCKDLALLKCTSNYPALVEEINLRGLNELAKEFGDATIGFSDHSRGIGAAPYAVACGARIIEKHFTLDKELDGPDHKASLSPEELSELVREVRRVEKMLGDDRIGPTKSETATKKALQKHFVACCDIDEGQEFTKANIVAKRTGGQGISANNLLFVIGKKSGRKFIKDEIICEADLRD